MKKIENIVITVLENFTSPFGMPIIIIRTGADSCYMERVFHIHLDPTQWKNMEDFTACEL